MRNNLLREDLDKVIELLRENDPKLTAGPRVRQFEEEWSEWLGVKYSVFVNSGSSANLLCLAWLKSIYPNGGKVIVPPFTWSSDISSIFWMGFEPLFVDITLETLACNEKIVTKTIDEDDEVKALFITHAQGINGLSEKVIRKCREKGIIIIEDVCESHGVTLENGRKAGTEGDVSCFSFYYAHHMSTIEGGMVCTDDPEIYQYLRMARAHGMLREASDVEMKENITSKYSDLNKDFIFTTPGFNFRNNEIGAIIGLSQLKRLDSIIEKRKENFKIFLEGLPSWAFKDFNLKGQSNYAFNLILKEKCSTFMSSIEDELVNNGVEFRRGSAGGGNQLRQPYIKEIIKKDIDDPSKEAPVADHIHFYGMYMGNFPDLKREEIEDLTKILRRINR